MSDRNRSRRNSRSPRWPCRSRRRLNCESQGHSLRPRRDTFRACGSSRSPRTRILRPRCLDILLLLLLRLRPVSYLRRSIPMRRRQAEALSKWSIWILAIPVFEARTIEAGEYEHRIGGRWNIWRFCQTWQWVDWECWDSRPVPTSVRAGCFRYVRAAIGPCWRRGSRSV